MRLKQRQNQRIRDFVREIDDAFVAQYGRSHSRDAEFNQFRRITKKEWLFDGMRKEIWNSMRRKIKNKNYDPNWNEVVEAAEDAEWLDELCYRQSYFVARSVKHRDVGDDFDIDRDGFVRVYADGACFRNGQPNAQAGIGIWFGRQHEA